MEDDALRTTWDHQLKREPRPPSPGAGRKHAGNGDARILGTIQGHCLWYRWKLSRLARLLSSKPVFRPVVWHRSGMRGWNHTADPRRTANYGQRWCRYDCLKAAVWYDADIRPMANLSAATAVPQPARRMPASMRDSTRKIAFRVPACRRSRCLLGGN
jgi:hypothetical protein